jgi:hypothetical protein
MEKLNDYVDLNAPNLVLTDPGTRENRIYFIKTAIKISERILTHRILPLLFIAGLVWTFLLLIMFLARRFFF